MEKAKVIDIEAAGGQPCLCSEFGEDLDRFCTCWDELPSSVVAAARQQVNAESK